jgi:hypothetical protein
VLVDEYDGTYAFGSGETIRARPASPEINSHAR